MNRSRPAGDQPNGGEPVVGEPARGEPDGDSGPLRLLVVTTVHTPLDARIHHRQIRALVAAGVEVTYAAPWSATGTPRDAVVEGVRTIDLPRAAGRHRLRALRAARRLLRSSGGRVDLVLLHDPELALAALGQLSRLPPVVLDVHEDLPASLVDREWIPGQLRPLAVRASRLLERVAAGRLAGVLLAEHGYQQRLGGHPVVPNLPWLPTDAPPAGQHRRVVYLGRVSVGRGARDLIELARRLDGDDRVDVATEVIGPADADVRAELQAAHDAGLLRWHGFVANEDALSMVAGSVAGLSPLHDLANYRASMPTKVIEYLALGIPAVVTPLPEAEAVVTAADAGVVVPFGDVDAMLAAVVGLAGDAAELERLSANGRRYVARLHSWDAHAPDFVAHLQWVARR